MSQDDNDRMWSEDDIQDFAEKIDDEESEIRVVHFGEAMNAIEEFKVHIPNNFDDGLDGAIEILSDIQNYRDIIVMLKIAMVDKRNNLRGLWNKARSVMLLHDPDIATLSTVVQKEAAIKLTFPDLYDKFTLADDNVTNAVDLLDNAVAQFNTTSRIIAVMEMQINIGEIESKRSWGKN